MLSCGLFSVVSLVNPVPRHMVLTSYRAYTNRVVRDSSSNITCSLRAAQHHSANNVMLSQIHMHADQIAEHAVRRLDLFFYQLTSVYKLNEKYHAPIVISKAPTELQHGKGSIKLLTNACHSALFPSLDICFYRKSGEKISLTEAYKKTFLYQSLNSTVELPSPVNGFDGHLEGRARPSNVTIDGLSILNDTANAACDPRQGMGLFYQSVNRSFSAPLLAYFQRKGMLASILVKMAIYAYEKKGTFSGANAELNMLDEYLFLLLRIKREELESAANREELLERHYLSMRDEIWFK